MNAPSQLLLCLLLQPLLCVYAMSEEVINANLSPTLPTAPELTRIKREIQYEPEYQTKSPEYCLLVFGPSAKTRVWMVLDGDHVYVDRNGNGDLTERGERIQRKSGYYVSAELGEITCKQTGKSYTSIRWSRRSNGSNRVYAKLPGNRRQVAGFIRNQTLQFARNPESAPVIHFDGPLCFQKFNTLKPLGRGDSGKTRLALTVGSPGIGEGTFASLHYDCLKEHGSLVANIEYPGKEIEYPGTEKGEDFSVTETLLTKT